MKLLSLIVSLSALTITAPLAAQDAEKAKMLSPGQIVDQAPAEEWQAIAASDLLIMKLQPDAKGKERQVVIQLMPPPFSQGWVRNIRKLAKANWWDGMAINRVQDNYVVQWGDNAETEEERKPLPDGLEVMTEGQYVPDRVIAHSSDKAGLSISSERKDSYAELAGFQAGWPVAISVRLNRRSSVPLKHIILGDDPLGPEKTYLERSWPIHCYGAVGVGRGLSPDTGSGAELYTVIGHAPRHLDRNIAVVGRIIEGMHHLSSLPRGFGPLGFYETAEEQVPIQSIRLASELPATDQPRFEFLYTRGKSFAQYAHRRANREPPFFIKPAGGADICNIPVPVRRVKDAD